MSLGGVRGRLEGGVVGGAFLWKMREKGKGGREGGDRQRNRGRQVNKCKSFVETTLFETTPQRAQRLNKKSTSNDRVKFSIRTVETFNPGLKVSISNGNFNLD